MTRVVARVCLASIVLLSVTGAHVASGQVAPTGVIAQADGASPDCDSRDILLLIDQSQSLRDSDPDSQRVDGAQALLTGLANAEVNATLSVAGFGNTVTPRRSFDLPAQRTEAEEAIEAFRGVQTDQNTDYVLAMLAAVDYFESRTTPPECRTLMWFTDGAYDIEDASPALVGSYTTLSNPDEILANFAGAVCGPLPPESTLTAPLVDQIAFDFVIRLIDLRGNPTGSSAAKRARTDEVLNRLLTDGPDGTCGNGIKGSRIDVSQADEIVRVFFEESQVQAGRTKIDCAALQSGVPASVVQSVAVMGLPPATAQVEIRIGDEIRATGATTQYSLTPEDRSRTASVTIAAAAGELTSCFIDASATIEAIGEPQLYEDAETTPVFLAVGNSGVGAAPLAGVGESVVALTAKLDGELQTIVWDSDAQHWRVEIPKRPVGAETRLEVLGAFVGSLEGSGPVAPVSVVIPVRDVPGAPQVRWTGPTDLEGSGILDGAIEISPTADVDAQVCFKFTGLPADLVAVDGSGAVGRVEADSSEVCGPASDGLQLPTRVVVDKSLNATGSATITFEATFEPAGEAERPMGDGMVIVPEFTLRKPLDSSTQLRLAVLLAAASAVLTYLLMLGFTAIQAKLRDPGEMLVASTNLEKDASTGRLHRVDSGALIRLSDLKQVVGSRTKYQLGDGLVLRRRLSLNPFGRLSAVLRSDRYMLAAHPSISAATGDRRRVAVPLRFGSLVIVSADPTTGGAKAMTLVPIGTSPSATVNIIDDGLRRLDAQLRNLPDRDRAANDNPDGVSNVAHPAPPQGRSPGGDSTEAPAAAPPARAPEQPVTAVSTRRPPPPPHRR